MLSSRVTLYEDSKPQQRLDKSSTSHINSPKYKSATFLNVHETKTTEDKINTKDCVQKFMCPICKVNDHRVTECENLKKN